MSKKKKKKLKKKKAQKKQQIIQNNSPNAVVQEAESSDAPEKSEVGVPTESVGKDENIYEEIYKDQRYSYIRKDVVKVLMVLLALIIILIAIYLLDKSYSFLGPVGDWLYKIMNIQTQ